MQTLSHSSSLIDYSRWEENLASLRSQFQNAQPYPHIVFDDFLNEDVAREIMHQFPKPDDAQWVHYAHVNERKMAQTKMDLLPPTARKVVEELNGPRFIHFLESLSGLSGLLPDESLQGGGLHQSKRGGYLNVHADFTSHPHRETWARRINVIVYFNEGWQESYGGKLGLWDRDVKNCLIEIMPVFNRCVIFRTDRESFHGHPEPLQCPENMTRKSLALYYFTEEAERPFTRGTEYKARPGDTVGKRALIFADKMALKTFFFMKRRLGLSDQAASRIVKLFSRH